MFAEMTFERWMLLLGMSSAGLSAVASLGFATGRFVGRRSPLSLFSRVSPRRMSDGDVGLWRGEIAAVRDDMARMNADSARLDERVKMLQESVKNASAKMSSLAGEWEDQIGKLPSHRDLQSLRNRVTEMERTINGRT